MLATIIQEKGKRSIMRYKRSDPKYVRNRTSVRSVLGIICVAVLAACLLGACEKSDTGEAKATSDTIMPTSKPTPKPTPEPTPNPLEELAGDYKRTVFDTGKAGGGDKTFSDILNLFGDVILTLNSDGTGLMDFSGMGVLAGQNEPVTWDADNTISFSGEDGTWRFEGDTLYIEMPDVYYEFERTND